MLTYNYPEVVDYFGRKVKLDWVEDSEHDGIDLPYYESAIREGTAKLLLAYNDTTDPMLKHVVKATATAGQLVMGNGAAATATAGQLVLGNGAAATATANQLVMGNGKGATATAGQLVLGNGNGATALNNVCRQLNADYFNLDRSGSDSDSRYTATFNVANTPDLSQHKNLQALLIFPRFGSSGSEGIVHPVRLTRTSTTSTTYSNTVILTGAVTDHSDATSIIIESYRTEFKLSLNFNTSNNTCDLTITKHKASSRQLKLVPGATIAAYESGGLVGSGVLNPLSIFDEAQIWLLSDYSK